MTINTQILAADVEYGVPSGNYDGSSLDWLTIAVPAANYYLGRPGLQSVTFQVSDFLGVIAIEATLDTLPDTASWFETYTYGDVSSIATDQRSTTIHGNFTWIRARVENFTAGTIIRIIISY